MLAPGALLEAARVAYHVLTLTVLAGLYVVVGIEGVTLLGLAMDRLRRPITEYEYVAAGVAAASAVVLCVASRRARHGRKSAWTFMALCAVLVLPFMLALGHCC